MPEPATRKLGIADEIEEKELKHINRRTGNEKEKDLTIELSHSVDGPRGGVWVGMNMSG